MLCSAALSGNSSGYNGLFSLSNWVDSSEPVCVCAVVTKIISGKQAAGNHLFDSLMLFCVLQ